MTDNASPDFGRLRPVTVVALAVLLVAWSAWKIYKLHHLWKYGFFSWPFMGATLLGVIAFLGCLAVIFWAFESRMHEDR